MIRRYVILLLLSFNMCVAWSGTMCGPTVETGDSLTVSLDSIASGADEIACRLDSIALRLDDAALRLDAVVHRLDSLNSIYDEEEQNRWKRVILRHGWSINDTTIKYPMLLDFGVKAYRWLNHALNYYDTTYVTNPGKTTGKKWKIMLKNDNWIDFYSGHLSQWKSYVQMNSDVTSLFGYQICGMGLSFTYMINARDLLAGRFIRNRRLQFSFTTSRIFVEA